MKKSIILAILMVFLLSTSVLAVEVTVTSGSPRIESWGSNSVLVYKITDVDDDETLTTNLGTALKWYFAVSVTDAADTWNLTESDGTLTFDVASDNRAYTVFVGF